MSFDWEECALSLLEMNLNGHSLNHNSLKQLFQPDPGILEDLDIKNGENDVEDIDKALYGGRPQVIEIREAKPTEVYHCKACNRSFKRGDNFRRHLQSKLHQKRQRALEIAAREDGAEKDEINL